MTNKVLNTTELPFCPGCGHHLIAKNTAKAIEELNYNILDIIFVTDIGCHGIIDKTLNTHTVHGLHGRSVALGAGISMGLHNNQKKKVIVFLGDGGATIGLQHILEAARLNVDMTVIVHNNFLYGMTGGQLSGLTPKGFNTIISLNGNPFEPHDIIKLVNSAGANYCSRILGIGDFSATIKKALSTKGFSLIEVMEICPSYGVKYNPKKKLQEIVESAGFKLVEYTNNREPFSFSHYETVTNLFDKVKTIIPTTYNTTLNEQIQIVLSGSAGEGIQSAASILCRAAMLQGYNVTQKGTYPVTVGVGFSNAEVNISPYEIFYHGLYHPKYLIVTSIDGLEFSKNTIKNLPESSTLLIDDSLELPETKAKVIKISARKKGEKNAILVGLIYFSKLFNVVSIENLLKILKEDVKTFEKLPVDDVIKEIEKIKE
ncbi:MAG: thiamine pyrophosphate-dependent enzyme [Bacteroidales bacterium]|nr:thiamine pyrophosphate-dependent enzyme [Bacteroidales bacterium]